CRRRGWRFRGRLLRRSASDRSVARRDHNRRCAGGSRRGARRRLGYCWRGAGGPCPPPTQRLPTADTGAVSVKVEVLYFDGCPNHEQLLPRLRELLDRAKVSSAVELVRVPD